MTDMVFVMDDYEVVMRMRERTVVHFCFEEWQVRHSNTIRKLCRKSTPGEPVAAGWVLTND